MNWLLGVVAKIAVGIFDSFRRDKANQSLGAERLRADTAEKTLEAIRKMEGVTAPSRADAVERLRANGL